jgi:hypothetical protein
VGVWRLWPPSSGSVTGHGRTRRTAVQIRPRSVVNVPPDRRGRPRLPAPRNRPPAPRNRPPAPRNRRYFHRWTLMAKTWGSGPAGPGTGRRGQVLRPSAEHRLSVGRIPSTTIRRRSESGIGHKRPRVSVAPFQQGRCTPIPNACALYSAWTTPLPAWTTRPAAVEERRRSVDNDPLSVDRRPTTPDGPKPPHLAARGHGQPQHLVVSLLTTHPARRKVHGSPDRTRPPTTPLPPTASVGRGAAPRPSRDTDDQIGGSYRATHQTRATRRTEGRWHEQRVMRPRSWTPTP